MKETITEPYYEIEAKVLINLLFDKRFLADDLSRESIDWLEDYIGFLFQSKCEMATKSALLLRSLKS